MRGQKCKLPSTLAPQRVQLECMPCPMEARVVDLAVLIVEMRTWFWGTVMFLAGGNKKEGRSRRGARSKGLPGSITTRRGACLTRRREGGPRRAEFKGGNKFEEGEQIRYSDYSTWQREVHAI
jgi:hypothetical protein